MDERLAGGGKSDAKTVNADNGWKNKRLCMRKLILTILVCQHLLAVGFGQSGKYSVSSPDKQVVAGFYLGEDGSPRFTINHKGHEVLAPSALGLVRSDGDFASGLSILSVEEGNTVTDEYHLMNAKRSDIVYAGSKLVAHLAGKNMEPMDIIFQVSNDGVAFRYYFPSTSPEKKTITGERTTYTLNADTRGWLQPMQQSKSGWEHTNPAYEEHYLQDIPAGTPSPTGAGWVYPALFKTADTWLLITEAGLAGDYCATRLHCDSGSRDYHTSFPDAREVVLGGGLLPNAALPWYSPWRIVTVGSLATIAESTLGTDLARPAISFDADYVKPGKAAWSWIMSKDDSIVYSEQKRYIDLAASMHWQYCLIDADWDRKIGYEKIRELSAYAGEKKVGLLLWYNSAGDWNTVKYTPKNLLLTTESRQKEFARLQSMGIKGVKIDFFGGDGQSVIQYYTDILNDAARYNLLVNFHGATLPRGWARTYPHLMTTEAVRGFEMITFNQADADAEPNHCAMLPFTRNAFDPMDFTPMNLYRIPTRVQRKTTSAFELATAVLFLSGIQHYAESPDGMAQMPAFVVSFLQQLPDYWEDVKFIDGFPGKLAIIARYAGDRWYIAGINGENTEKKINLNLSWLKQKQGNLITDGQKPLTLVQQSVKVGSKGNTEITIKPNGGFVMIFQD